MAASAARTFRNGGTSPRLQSQFSRPQLIPARSENEPHAPLRGVARCEALTNFSTSNLYSRENVQMKHYIRAAGAGVAACWRARAVIGEVKEGLE